MWSDKTLQKTVKTQTSGHLVFFTPYFSSFHPGMCMFHPRQYVVRQNLAKNSENINFRPLGIFHPVFFIRIFQPGMCIFYPWQYVVRQNLAKNIENINFRPLGFFHPVFFIRIFQPGMCIFYPWQYVVRQNLANNSENINFRPLGGNMWSDKTLPKTVKT